MRDPREGLASLMVSASEYFTRTLNESPTVVRYLNSLGYTECELIFDAAGRAVYYDLYYKLVALRKRYESGEIESTDPLVDYLDGWYLDHQHPTG